MTYHTCRKSGPYVDWNSDRNSKFRRFSRRLSGGVMQITRQADYAVRTVLYLAVVEAIDGPITLNECVTDPSMCAFGDKCAVHNVWCRAQMDLVSQLSQSDFATLATAQRAMSNGSDLPTAS